MTFRRVGGGGKDTKHFSGDEGALKMEHFSGDQIKSVTMYKSLPEILLDTETYLPYFLA